MGTKSKKKAQNKQKAADAVVSAAPAKEGADTPMEEPAAQDARTDSSGEEEVVGGAPWPAGELSAVEQIIASERLRGVLALPECQTLAESVLENTIFNLIQEAAHGDLDLTVLPKTVFRADAD